MNRKVDSLDTGAEMANQLQVGSDLMRPEDLAAEWLISPKTLANLRSRGEGPPYVRVLGSIRYSRRECADWLAAQNANPRCA